MSKKVSRRELEETRKKRIAVANRWLGWLTLIAYLLPRIHPILEEQNITLLPDNWLGTLQAAFMFFIFLHGIAAIYLYGVPIFKWHNRVLQMYLGFIIFAIFMLNRSFINVPVLLTVTDVLIWIPVVAHVLLGLRYLGHRLIRPSTYPKMPFYLGGAIVRDFTRDK